MKNIILCATILLAGFASGAQNSLTSNLPATSAIAGANVTILKDQTILVRYVQNDIAYKAFYDKNGAWLHTVASYGETSLPESTRRLVKRSWHGWNITYVDEVQSPGEVTVYRVQVKHDKRLVILRVAGDEIVTEKELSSL
jgi:hypothetical protein